MITEPPGLARRLAHTGVPLLLCRLILGVMFLAMGLAKTGLLGTALNETGLRQAPAIKTIVDKDKGWIALSNPVDFLKLIREYQMLPENLPVLINSMAALLPWVEVLCGVLLITGAALRGSALVLLVMLIFFTIIVTWRAVGIYNSTHVPFCSISFDCGCGAGVVYICHKIFENVALSLLSLLVLLSRSRRFCLRADLIGTPSTA